jgi:hypothetical protein
MDTDSHIDDPPLSPNPPPPIASSDPFSSSSPPPNSDLPPGPKLPSRVLDDVFHFMDRLFRLLPKKHSAFKAFAHDFSEAIFIRDSDDKARVRAALEAKGISWEYAKRAKASVLYRRIRRYISPVIFFMPV